MKKSVIILGFVFSLITLTSCTTDDMDREMSNSKVQFEEEINQSLYQRNGDTIVVPSTQNTSQANDGDPIVKPKRD